MSDPQEPDELADGLRRLFDDDRLSIAQVPGAKEAVVAGAQRTRRRRRMATSAAAMTGVLMLAGAVFAMPQAEEGMPSVAAPTETAPEEREQVPTLERDGSASPDPQAEPSATPPAEQQQPLDDRETGPTERQRSTEPQQPEESAEARDGSPDRGRTLREHGGQQTDGALGPNGYRQVRLGMTFEDVRDAGLLADDDARPPKGCRAYTLAEGTQAVRDVTISAETGVAIVTASGAENPAGVRIGTPKERVASAHPDLHRESGGYHASAGERAHYRFAFADTDGDEQAVEGMSLRSDDQDCASG